MQRSTLILVIALAGAGAALAADRFAPGTESSASQTAAIPAANATAARASLRLARPAAEADGPAPAIGAVRIEPDQQEWDEPCLDGQRIDGARIVALGAYEGDRKLPIGFEGDSHAVGLIGVQGATKGDPLVVVLSAYDPVVWDFSTFPIERLRAVLAYGYHGQAVANVPARIPVRIVTHRHGGGAICGEPAHAYKAGNELDQLDATIQAVLGRQIAAFYGTYSPSALHVDGGEPRAVQTTKPLALRASAPIANDAVRPGEQGLHQLINEGAIRPATAADIAAWNEAATKARRSGRLAPYRSEYLRSGRTFVLLGQVRLPRDMYGAHSRSFIVPPGVPMPDDPGSHNSYYRISDGSCTGAVPEDC
jgi:hypothetical protein